MTVSFAECAICLSERHNFVGINSEIMGKYADAYQFLAPFLTERRRELLETAVGLRTRYVSVVLEDIYNPHNVSAILRSCDCFGVQDVHLAEQRYAFAAHTDTARGADKWLSIYSHGAAGSTARAIVGLQAQGYRVLATSPHAQAAPIDDIDLSLGKVALLLGNEKEGVSADAARLADGLVSVPMVGFSESLNVSVTAAVCLHSLRSRLMHCGIDWQLTVDEREYLLFDWARKSAKSADDLLRLKYENFHELAEELSTQPADCRANNGSV